MLVIPFTVPHDAREPVQFVFSDGARSSACSPTSARPPRTSRRCCPACDALVLECNHDLDLLMGRSLPEVAQAAHRRAVRPPRQRGFGAPARRARLLAAEAHHRRAPLAAEQQSRARPQRARARAELRRGLDRPRHPGRRLRLAGPVVRTLARYFFIGSFLASIGSFLASGEADGSSTATKAQWSLSPRSSPTAAGSCWRRGRGGRRRAGARGTFLRGIVATGGQGKRGGSGDQQSFGHTGSLRGWGAKSRRAKMTFHA